MGRRCERSVSVVPTSCGSKPEPLQQSMPLGSPAECALKAVLAIRFDYFAVARIVFRSLMERDVVVGIFASIFLQRCLRSRLPRASRRQPPGRQRRQRLKRRWPAKMIGSASIDHGFREKLKFLKSERDQNETGYDQEKPSISLAGCPWGLGRQFLRRVKAAWHGCVPADLSGIRNLAFLLGFGNASLSSWCPGIDGGYRSSVRGFGRRTSRPGDPDRPFAQSSGADCAEAANFRYGRLCGARLSFQSRFSGKP